MLCRGSIYSWSWNLSYIHSLWVITKQSWHEGFWALGWHGSNIQSSELEFELVVTFVLPSKYQWDVVEFMDRSAFFFYCADARPQLRLEQPGLSVAEVAKELGRRWETLPDRPKFEALASKDKERYEKVSIHMFQRVLLQSSMETSGVEEYIIMCSTGCACMWAGQTLRYQHGVEGYSKNEIKTSPQYKILWRQLAAA